MQNNNNNSLRSLRQIVLKETEGGARIIRSVVAIAEGIAPNCTPWHQIEAAKLLLKLGFDDANEIIGGKQAKRQQAPAPAQPADINAPSSDLSLHSGEACPRPRSGNENPSQIRHSRESGNPEGRGEDHASCPSCELNSAHANPERQKANERLVAGIRVASYEGATIIRALLEILEGADPDAKPKDKIEAAKVLLEWGFGNPNQPSPESMLFYAPCHPDCLCACKYLPEDHPEVAKAHKPLTPEQRRERAEAQAREEESDKRAAELIERKMRNERRDKLAEFHSTEAKDDRRIEREEQRKKRQKKKEEKAAYELDKKRKRVEAISREMALERDIARDEELERERARESEPDTADPGSETDFYYEPLSPEDQALFDYQTRLESGEFKEGELTLKPPSAAARKHYAVNLEAMRRAAASEGVPLLPNPLSGTLRNPTARGP